MWSIYPAHLEGGAMKNQAAIRERYLREDLPMRLGELAANLVRIHSFLDHLQHCEVVAHLLEETKFFIEWTLADTGSDLQPELLELQRRLINWQTNWAEIWAEPDRRASMAQQADDWSQRILKIAGLLP
jgi:hypothetical protein